MKHMKTVSAWYGCNNTHDLAVLSTLNTPTNSNGFKTGVTVEDAEEYSTSEL